MSSPVCLGQPPLPPKKFSKVSMLQNFLKSDKSQSSKLLRRYSLRKKHPDRFSCTYQSFSKDLYEGGAVSIRSAASINGGGKGKGNANAIKGDNANSKFAGKFPYSDFCESTTSLSGARSRRNSLNSILTLSRSHSDGNLSSVSDDAAIFVNNANQRRNEDDNDVDVDDHRHPHAFHNITVPCTAAGEQQGSLSKYFRALSGSWKNLLNPTSGQLPSAPPPALKRLRQLTSTPPPSSTSLSYQELLAALLKSEKELYVLRCGKDHRIIIKFFEILIQKVIFAVRPDFINFTRQVKDQSFREEHDNMKNPMVTFHGVSKQYLKLTYDENVTYYRVFRSKRLTKKEQWHVFSKWLAFSDEYKYIFNGTEVKRLNLLVDKFRDSLQKTATSDHPLTPELLADCILKNWDRLSNIVKVGPDYDLSDLFINFHKIASADDNLSKFCGFLLESIVKEVPLTPTEKKSIKQWPDYDKIRFSDSSLVESYP